ncbi:unnamed protein product, partial [Symbiodinium microadriaticum]
DRRPIGSSGVEVISPLGDGSSLSFSGRGICTLRAYLPLPAPGRYFALTTMSGSKSSYAIRLVIASYLTPADRSASTVAHLVDFSALDDPASSHDAAYAHEPYDFHEDGTPPAQPIDLHLLLSRFRSLDLRARVLEAERSGAQQALWHHHRAATDSQRLRSLISPWAYMSSKVDAIRVSLQRAVSRLSSLLITLQQSFPAIAQFFTEQALDSASYQGPLLDGSDVDAAA